MSSNSTVSVAVEESSKNGTHTAENAETVVQELFETDPNWHHTPEPEHAKEPV